MKLYAEIGDRVFVESCGKTGSVIRKYTKENSHWYHLDIRLDDGQEIEVIDKAHEYTILELV